MDQKDSKKPRKRDREATIKLINEAAISIFSKVGFDKATTKSIAEKAGVAEALIIRYFGSKRGLLLSILSDFQNTDNDSSALSFPLQDTLEDDLVMYANEVLQGIFSNQIFKIIIVHSLVDEKFSKELMKLSARKNIRAKLKIRLDHFRSKGDIPNAVSDYQIDKFLSYNYLSMILLSENLYGISKEESEKLLAHYVRSYAIGLKNQ